MSEQTIVLSSRRRIVRLAAAATALALSTAGFGLTALSAQAGAITNDNGVAHIEVSIANTSPAAGDTVTVTGVVSSANSETLYCETAPTVTYSDSQSQTGSLEASWDGQVYTYSYDSLPLEGGESFSSTLTANGECANPASEYGSITSTSNEVQAGEAGADVSWPAPTIDTLEVGVAYDETFTAPSDGDWDWCNGGTASLSGSLPEGLDWEVVDEWVTGTAPGIRIFGTPTEPGEFGVTLSATDSSENTADTGLFGFMVTGDEEDPATSTNTGLICDYDDDYYSRSGRTSTDVETNSVYWETVCETDPTVDDAGTFLYDRSDAFDVFGYVVFDQGDDDEYVVTADEFDSEDIENGKSFTLVDRDVHLMPQDVTVTVTVTRVIQGSFMRWTVEVRDADNEALVDVPFSFEGGLGSDGSTEWSGSGAWRVSHDDGSDPILAHTVSASGYSWETEDGDDDPTVEVTSGGQLTYTFALIDYDCPAPEVLEGAEAIAQDLDSYFGDDLDPLESNDGCYIWEPVVGALQVGVPFDQTLTLPEGYGWNWSDGGSIELDDELPAGLEYEILNEWGDSVPPSIRIFGTPTEAGEFEVWAWAWDDYNGYTEAPLTFTITPASTVVPPADADLTLGINVGDPVAGAPATATANGLQEGADYTITVRSTPIIVGSGTVPAGGTVSQVVYIPAGLEAGWHSITFSSTFYTGVAFDKVLWFKIGADGTLLETSLTAPALAYTGSDPKGPISAAIVLLVIGGMLVAKRRREQNALI